MSRHCSWRSPDCCANGPGICRQVVSRSVVCDAFARAIDGHVSCLYLHGPVQQGGRFSSRATDGQTHRRALPILRVTPILANLSVTSQSLTVIMQSIDSPDLPVLTSLARRTAMFDGGRYVSLRTVDDEYLWTSNSKKRVFWEFSGSEMNQNARNRILQVCTIGRCSANYWASSLRGRSSGSTFGWRKGRFMSFFATAAA